MQLPGRWCNADLSSLDRATQANIEFVETALPDCWSDRLALKLIYDELRAEIGALDIEQPELREMLDEVRTSLIRIADFLEPWVGREPELPDIPGEERVELFKEAVHVSRLAYS